jgi:hypothetical protein
MSLALVHPAPLCLADVMPTHAWSMSLLGASRTTTMPPTPPELLSLARERCSNSSLSLERRYVSSLGLPTSLKREVSRKLSEVRIELSHLTSSPFARVITAEAKGKKILILENRIIQIHYVYNLNPAVFFQKKKKHNSSCMISRLKKKVKSFDRKKKNISNNDRLYW